MKGAHLSIFCGFMTLLAFGSAQYYGSYGRDVLIRPQVASYPYSPNPYTIQSRLAAPQFLTRVNADMPQNVRMASTQISRGSELFSFDMYRVSFIPFLKKKKNYFEESYFNFCFEKFGEKMIFVEFCIKIPFEKFNSRL